MADQEGTWRITGQAAVRFGVVVVAVVASAMLGVGCSSGSGSVDQSGAVVTTTAPMVSPEIRVVVPPGSSPGFVGARKDVTSEACVRSGSDWITEGTVQNPTQGMVDYRIYTSFNDSGGELRALVESDVIRVGPNLSGQWSSSIALSDDNLNCILRVERSPVTR